MKINNADREVVFVAGGAGYVGSHTCKALYNEGYLPVVLDNLSTGYKWAVKWGPLEIVDLRDEILLKKIFEKYSASAVFMLAGCIAASESMIAPIKYWQNNLTSLMNLVSCCVDYGVCDFVFSSTAAVYGALETTSINESHSLNPINTYGETKLASERFLLNCKRAHQFNPVALRYFNASGADPDGDIGEAHVPETHLIPLAIRAALDPDFELKVFGADYDTKDGTCIRDYIHVSDLADAHIASLSFLRQDCFLRTDVLDVFNLGSRKGYSVEEIIKMVEHVTTKKVKRTYVERRPGDPGLLIADSSLARKIMNWQPKLSTLELIIETAVKWDKKSQSQLI